MFYTLSKALLFLIQPSVWLLALVILGLLTRSRRRRKRYAMSALLLFLILGNEVLYEKAMKAMEWPPVEKAEYHETAVLLGGFGEYNTQRNGIELFRTSDRLTETAALYHEGRIGKILLSSGVHEEGHPEWNEALISKTYLVRIGIPEADIFVEDASWNTYENAVHSGHLLDSLGMSPPYLLVTSAFHMKRAMACFVKQELQCTAYPVDYIYDDEQRGISSYLLPSMDIMIEWQIPMKEWVGMQVYRLRGYI